jgi:hypothetical protein
LLAARAGYPALAGLREGPLERDVAGALAAVDERAQLARCRAAVEGAAVAALPKVGGDATRLPNLRVANNELALLLGRSERRRQAADAVTRVLRALRPADGDPLSNLMFRTMEWMGFKRVAFLEPDLARQRLVVRTSSAVQGNTPVPEGAALPFPDADALPAPAVALRGDGVAAHAALCSSCWTSPPARSLRWSTGRARSTATWPPTTARRAACRRRATSSASAPSPCRPACCSRTRA